MDGRALARRRFAVTAWIAEPSIDLPINVGRSIAVGRGIRRVGPLFMVVSTSVCGFVSSTCFGMTISNSVCGFVSSICFGSVDTFCLDVSFLGREICRMHRI